MIMNKKRLFTIISISTPLVIAGAILLAHHEYGLILPVDAGAVSRTLTFDKNHSSATSSAGNQFSCFWINKTDSSAFNSNNSLAYLNGHATYDARTDSYVATKPQFGIKCNNYKFSSITKIEITYQITEDHTDFFMYKLKDDETIDTSIGWIIEPESSSGDNTYTVSSVLSNVKGIAFCVDYNSSGWASSTEYLGVKCISVKITYTC